MSKRILFTVTNDLQYDQRMQRICSTLARDGFEVTLVGRILPTSTEIKGFPFKTHRFRCFVNKGALFYAEFNLRLFFLLLFRPFDILCSIDFDTIPAGATAAFLRRKKRVFDAHEYFTEVPELVHRRFVKKIWAGIGRLFVPCYHAAYTVSPALAEIFTQKYRLPFQLVRNVPFYTGDQLLPVTKPPQPILLYQGALNEGRGIEYLLEAMQSLDGFELWLAGEGDLSDHLRAQAKTLQVEDRVRFLGWVAPPDLQQITRQAWLGINLLENKGLSYYYSLANKFFDSVQAAIPMLTMDFPEYKALNAQYEVAILLPQLQVADIVKTIQQLHQDPVRYKGLETQCLQARQHWIWEKDQTILKNIYWGLSKK
jgi:glycosyltransferase involved in cell wall biosynthesis